MIYHATDTDTSSDDGHWLVIVEAKTKQIALRIIKNHLKEQKRQDLITEDLEVEVLEGPLYYSSVERGSD